MKEWLEEEVFHDGDLFFEGLLSAVDSARRSVDFESYIFDKDSLGRKVLDHLIDAASRGVQVRLLLDAFGSLTWGASDLASLRKKGIKARLYHPLPWNASPRASLLTAFLRINRRNHRKACVIDSETAFVGGMNVSARHLRSISGKSAWRDSSARVRGDQVALLAQAFQTAWSGRKARQRLGVETFVRLNDRRPTRRALYRDLIRRILKARGRIWIASPYFVPDLTMLRALRFTAWSGADVRLLLPAKNDIFGMKWISGAYYSVLLRAGVRIFEYLPSMMHAKIALIDDWATVGSSNLNHRSLIHDLEVDVVLTHKRSILAVQEGFVSDFALSREIRVAQWRRRSWFRKILERIALTWKYWF